MNRRAYLATGASIVGASVVGTAAGWAAVRPVDRSQPEPSDEMAATVRTILPGTDHETPLYELDSGTPGPTVMALGGVHGDEVNGYRAAEELVEWTIDRGSLVVVPWANVVAIDRDSRTGKHGDLNRQFPSGEEPTTDLARAIWEAVLEYDPDVVLDLHRSRGILGTHAKWVGQTVLPTPPAVDEAEAVVEAVNDEVVPTTMPFHRFVVGPTLSSGPVLIQKVASDLSRPGYVVELTDYLLDLDTQVRWTLDIVERLLGHHGIERVST